MGSRTFQATVLLLWLGSLTWLFATKIIPTRISKRTPQQATIFPPQDAFNIQPVSWEILWNDRRIGDASTEWEISNRERKIRSVVRFDSLPLDELVRGFLGPVQQFLTESVSRDVPHDWHFEVQSEIVFTENNQPESLRSRVDLDGLNDTIELQGVFQGDELAVTIFSRQADGDQMQKSRELFRSRFPVPRDAFVADLFSPIAQFRDLRVGQSWRFHAYRPSSLLSPMKFVHADVVNREIIDYHGNSLTAMKVSFRELDNLSAASEPLSHLWVQDDGTVLRQQLIGGTARIEFVRKNSKQP